MSKKLFLVKFKRNDEGLNELKIYKSNKLEVIFYIHETFNTNDIFIESIEEN